MDNEELIEFLSDLQEAIRKSKRFINRGQNREAVKELDEAWKQVDEKLTEAKEVHEEECLRNGRCPKCGGSLNYRVDLGIDVGTCTRCGATYE